MLVKRYCRECDRDTWHHNKRVALSTGRMAAMPLSCRECGEAPDLGQDANRIISEAKGRTRPEPDPTRADAKLRAMAAEHKSAWPTFKDQDFLSWALGHSPSWRVWASGRPMKDLVKARRNDRAGERLTRT